MPANVYVDSSRPDWAELRDAWWRWHIVRLVLVVGAYARLQGLAIFRAR